MPTDQTPAATPTEWHEILTAAYALVPEDKRDAIGEQICEAYSFGVASGVQRSVARFATVAAERDQLRYERQLLGACRRLLDNLAENALSANLRRAAGDLAQRIVDEIGHPVTDEPALGPSLRAQLADLETDNARLERRCDRLTAQRDERLTLAESSKLAKMVDDLRARAERAEQERDREHQKAIAYLQWRDHTAAIASTLVDAIDEWFGPPAGVGPVRKAAEHMREVLTLDPEKTYGQNIPDVVTAPVPGSSRRAPEAGDRVEDGGMMGTLVCCKVCGGSGLLHQPDELPETATPTPEPNEPVGVHDWAETSWGSAPAMTACTRCGIVQRRDGANGPCRGPSRVELRAQEPDLFAEVADEMDRQDVKWGVQDHPDGTGWSSNFGSARLAADRARQRTQTEKPQQHDPASNCYCGGPESIYPHKHGTGRYCKQEAR